MCIRDSLSGGIDSAIMALYCSNFGKKKLDTIFLEDFQNIYQKKYGLSEKTEKQAANFTSSKLNSSLYNIEYNHQENIKDFDKLFVDTTCYEIEEILIRNKKLSIKLKGIEDRTEVEALRSKEVYVLEKQLPNLKEGEYYWFQLENLNVINEQNELLGAIDHVMPTGANDVLAVKPIK